ncbi:MAG TPA: DinB family protein [bacterium]|nr:DinB family protein [bacterium]
MATFVGTMLRSQGEAALAMLRQCVAACPTEQYEGRIARDTFRTVAYHTLFWTDYYLSPGEQAFELSDIHQCGGDDRVLASSPGLPQHETLAYADACREKLGRVLAAETLETLGAPCGFSRLSFSRGELYIYTLRHIQHHTGALSAYLRRTSPSLQDRAALRWVRAGWPPDAA